MDMFKVILKERAMHAHSNVASVREQPQIVKHVLVLIA
jgi:hypothetical protein